MKDLFCDRTEHMTAEQRLIRAIFGDSNDTWLSREEEARTYMSDYIGKHPEDLLDAVIKVSDIESLVRDHMDDKRREYIRDTKQYGDPDKDPENAFAYARSIAILGVIRWMLRSFIKTEGNCFIHLCDKGCEAVRAIWKEERK